MSKPPFEHHSNANRLSKSLYTCKTFRFSTAHDKPAPNSLTSKPITQPPLIPPTYTSFFPPYVFLIIVYAAGAAGTV